MWRSSKLLVVGLTVLNLTGVVAAETPVAVSPGREGAIALIDWRCPTFSWGTVAEASEYDLLVYELDEETPAAHAVLTKRFPGSVHSWTPALDECLRSGRRFAWSVRAAVGGKTSDWSRPRLFQLAPEPTAQELESALRVLRRNADSERPGSGAEDKGMPADGYERPATEANSGGRAPRPAAVGTPQLDVDGGVVAESFTGDGSTLSNLDPLNLASAVPVGQGGTGAATASGARSNLGAAASTHGHPFSELTGSLLSTQFAGAYLEGLTLTNPANTFAGDGSGLVKLQLEHQYFEQAGGQNSNVRDAYVTHSGEITIVEDGTYLIFYSGAIAFLVENINSAPSDTAWTLELILDGSSTVSIIDAVLTFGDSIQTPGGVSRYSFLEPERASGVDIRPLKDGDILQLRYKVTTNGLVPGGGWPDFEIQGSEIFALRIGP